MSNQIAKLLADLAANPQQVELIDELDLAWSSDSDWETVVREVPVHARRLSDGASAARLLARSAYIARLALEDASTADALLNEALDRSSDAEAFAKAVVASVESAEDWDVVLGALEEAEAAVTSSAAKSRVALEQGRVQELHKRDAKAAIAAYKRAAELDSTHAEAFRSGRLLFAAAGNWEKVVTFLAAEAKLAGTPAAKAVLLTELAQVQFKQLSNVPSARAKVAEALALDENCGAALALSRQLPADVATAGTATLTALPTPAESAELAVQVPAPAPAAPAAPAPRPTTISQPPVAAVPRPAAAAAPSAVAPAFGGATATGAPLDPARLFPLGWDGVAHYIDEVREVAYGSGEGATRMGARVIDLLAREGADDISLAGEAWDLLTVADDKFSLARQLLASLYCRRAVWTELASRLADADAGEPDGGWAGALYVARFNALGERSGLSELVGRAGAAAQRDAQVLDAVSKGNWRKAQTTFMERFAQLGAAAETESYRELAYLALGFHAEDKVADSLRRVLKANKSDASARELAKAVYRRGEKWQPLAELLKQHAEEASREPAWRSSMLRELLRIYRDELKQEMLVVTTYQSLVQLHPSDLDLLEELGGRLEALGRWPDLIDVRRKRIAALDSDSDRIAAMRDLAQLYLARFSNQAEAIKLYEQIRELDETDEGAISSLEDLYDKRREWEKLISIKRMLAERAYGNADRIRYLRDAADVAATKARKPDLAVALWGEVLDCDANDLTALTALEQGYEREKNFAKLADVVERKAVATAEPAPKALALLKLAQLLGDRLGQTERALEVYEELLAVDPANARAREAIRKGSVDLQQWDRLESLYARDENWAEYARQLEGLVGTVKQAEVKVELAFKLWDVLSERLAQTDRGSKALERVLSVDAANERAAELLAPIYEARGDQPGLARVSEILLRHATDETVQRDLLMKLGLIARRMNDAAKAYNWLSRAVTTGELVVSVLDDLDAVSKASRNDRSLADVYGKVLSNLYDTRSDAWLSVAMRRAKLLDLSLSDAPAALTVYEEVLAAWPDQADALERQEVLLTRLSRWDDLLTVLEDKAALAQGDARVVLLRRIATLQDEQRKDEAAAIDAYRALREAVPTDLPALQALRRLYRAANDGLELASVLTDLVGLSSGAASVDLRLELAAVYLDLLDDTASALEVVTGLATDAPKHPKVKSLLERLLDADAQRLAAALLLEPIYTSESNWKALVSSLEIQLEASEVAATRRGLLERIGQLQLERLNDGAGAWKSYEALLRAEPRSTLAQTRLETLAKAKDLWRGYVALLEAVVDDEGLASADAERAVELFERAAQICDKTLGQHEEAVRLLRRVLDVDGRRESTMVQLEALLVRLKDWEANLEVIEMRLSLHTDAAQRKGLLVRAAGLWEEMLESPERSIEVWRRLADEQSEDRDALSNLDRLFGLTGDHAQQASVLASRVAHASGAERTTLLARLAALQIDQIGDIATGLGLWAEVLAAEPGHAGARAAVWLLLADDDYAVAAADLLQPLFEKEKAWEKVVAIVEARLRIAATPDERRGHVLRLTQLHASQLKRTDVAYGVARAHLGEFLGDSEVVGVAEKLAASAGKMPDFVAQLVALSRDESDEQLGTAMLGRAARLSEVSLSDVAGAVSLWIEVLERDDQHEDALLSLERLYGQSQTWEGLVGVLLRRAELPSSMGVASVRRGLLLQAAALYEDNLDAPAKAIDTYLAVLELDALDRDAVDALERLFTNAQRWEELVENYGRKLEFVTEPRSRREILFTLGAVFEKELDDNERAIEAFGRALAADESDLGAVEALDRLYAVTENWFELQRILELESRLVPAGEASRNTRYRLGRLLEKEQGDVPGALAIYAAILSEESGHGATRDALVQLIESGESAVEAALILAPIYRKERDGGRLAGVIEVIAEGAETSAAKHQHLVELAEVEESFNGSDEAAFGAYRRAATEEARGSTLDALERLAAKLANWRALSDFFRELAEGVSEPTEQRAILMRSARILEEQVEDRKAAIEVLEELAGRDANDAEALVALERLYQAEEAWKQVAETLQRQVDAAADAGWKRTLRLRMAGVMSEFLDRPGDAVETYGEVLRESEHDADAIASLEDLLAAGREVQAVAAWLEPSYRALGRWTALVSLNRARIEVESDADERYRIWLETAEVQVGQLDDRAAGLVATAQALMERPTEVSLRDQLEQFAAATGKWAEVADVFGDLLREDLSDDDRKDYAARQGRILESELRELEAAEKAWLTVLTVDEADGAALEALDRIYVAQKRWADLAPVLTRRRDAVFEPAQVVALLWRRAEVQEQHLDEVAAAVVSFEEILDADATYKPALDALERIFLASESWSRLFDVLERQLELATEDDARVGYLERMATLADELLDRADDAVDLWRRVAGIRPDVPAAWEQLSLLLERLERDQEWADVLDRLVELAFDAKARHALLQRAGRVQSERLDNADGAIERYAKALALQPENGDDLRVLRALYQQVGSAEPLADVLERLVSGGHVEESDESAIFVQLGELYADTIGDREKAVGAWERVLGRTPSSMDALDRLDGLFAGLGLWQKCADILEKKLELLTGDAERIEILHRIASIWTNESRDAAKAIAALERIADLDITDADACSALESLYEATENWSALAALIVDRAKATDDAWERKTMLLRAVPIYETRLENPSKAFTVVANALDLAPTEEELRLELERLADLAGEHAVLVDLYRSLIGRIAAEESDEATLPYRLSAGRVMEEKLGKPEMAEVFFDQALGIDGENAQALDALERIYTVTEDWSALSGILMRKVEVSYDPAVQTELLRRVGAIAEEKLSQLDAAAKAFQQALDVQDGDAVSYDALERIYAAMPDWRELVSVLERRADGASDAAEVVRCRSQVASIWANNLHDADRAIDAYFDALAARPDDVSVMVAVEPLLAAAEDWGRWLEVTERRLALLGSDAERVELLLARAEVQERSADDVFSAIASHEAVLAIAPGHDGAFEALERIFREQERFEDLVSLYDRRAAAAASLDGRVAARMRAAAVLVEQQDTARAIGSYEQALALRATELEALQNLAGLYEETENWRGAVELLDRAAAVSVDAEAKLVFHFHAGELLGVRLGEHAQALERFNHARDLDASRPAVLRGVAGALEALGRWPEAVEVQLAHLEMTTDVAERAALMTSIGRTHLAHLGLEAEGQRWLEDALELEPTLVRAAEALLPMYVKLDRAERARPLVKLLLEQTEERELAAAASLERVAGWVAESLLQFDEARTHYDAAIRIEGNNPETLLGLARVSAKVGEHRDAAEAYQELLRSFGDQFTPAQRIEATMAGARASFQVDDLYGARELTQQVLAQEPKRADALELLLQCCIASSDEAGALEARTRLLEVVPDSDRFRLLVQIGESYEAASDTESADRFFRQALEIDPNSRLVLNKLLNLYAESENWKRATETLGLLAAQETDTGRKARLLFSIGTMFRDQLEDGAEAVTFFNQALGEDPSLLEAFEAIDRLLTEAKDWNALQKNYRKMIERVSGDSSEEGRALQLLLYRNLGEVYRTRLGRYEEAIASFQLASGLAPGDQTIHEILADLYARSGASGAAVIAQHHRLIELEPFRFESYHTLYDLYLREKQGDKAWCVAGALTLLRQATPEQEAFYNKHLTAAPKAIAKAISAEQWRLIYHADTDVVLSNLFAAVSVSIRDTFSTDLKTLGLKKKDRLDLNDKSLLSNAIKQAALAADCGELLAYTKDGVAGVANANLHPAAVVVGKEMLSGKQPRELAFAATRAAALMRPEFYLASIAPKSDAIKPFFYAAVAVVTEQMPADAPVERVQQLAHAMQDLQPPHRGEIESRVKAVLEAGRNPDLSAWLRHADLTAARAALVASGDLRSAIEQVSKGVNAVGRANEQDRVRDLTLFAVSEHYFQLRSELGLALPASTRP